MLRHIFFSNRGSNSFTETKTILSIVRLFTAFYLYNRSQTRNSTIPLGDLVNRKEI
jgi:hypothetical protein